MVGAAERGKGVKGEAEHSDAHVGQEEGLRQAEGELELLK